MCAKITKIGITKDRISSRGGLTPFLKYIESIGTYGLVFKFLSESVYKINRGLQLSQFLKQMFAFFIDGTDMSMQSFDRQKDDSGYCSALELDSNGGASSHAIKRFFTKISDTKDVIFNKILHELFIWRLKITKPETITLGIDTMVMDNDDAQKREGCEVTYKKKKGFQPLHICWGRFLVDVLFRKGSAHSNHGTDFIDRVTEIVMFIRQRYQADVAIILCADSGFFDQKAFEHFEDKLHIHYIITGKLYTDIKDDLRQSDETSYGEIRKNKAVWKYLELGQKLKSWSKYRRCIITKLLTDDKGQFIMDFCRPDSIIYTNIGNASIADERLRQSGGARYFDAEMIIETSHQRGADELIHRSIKELAVKEQLPFNKFAMNRAYYFLLVITHFLFEAYKEDISYDIVPLTSYPNTFRRKMIDFAAKFTSKARNIILNVSQTIYDQLKLPELWVRCHNPIQIQLE
ncbi:MAG: IS1380 family transposase [Saprospiraceae bacterium]